MEEKLIKSSRSQSNSLNKKERKIICMIENNSGNKDKKIKFNELPPLNRSRNNNIKKNGADINISNINLDYKNKIDLNNTLKRRVDELNTELSKLKNEPNIQNFNTLENNYKLMSKELEELKHENSYIKNKLEEIYQKQNPKLKDNQNINSSKSKNKSAKRDIKNINIKQNNQKNNIRQNTFNKKNNSKNTTINSINLKNINNKNNIKNK